MPRARPEQRLSAGMQVCYPRHGEQVFESYWSSGRAAEALAPTYAVLDMTVYGRQEVCNRR
jgi:predicted dithiol-disulfide oxidoreductase (DUF899 family)